MITTCCPIAQADEVRTLEEFTIIKIFREHPEWFIHFG